MKVLATHSGNSYEIKITFNEGVAFAEIEGREYKLEVSEPESNVYLLKHAGRVYEIFVSPSQSDRESLNVSVGFHVLDVKVVDPKRLRGTGLRSADARGTGEIRTAMPGKVVKLLKATGDTVKAGDGVIIVEAMKMQNEMTSPKDGTIKEIRFEKGDTVNASDILVVID